MGNFYLITWKQFEKRKLLDFSEIVNIDDVDQALEHIKTMNAQKRLTTTDYRSYNLTKLFEDNSLTISEVVSE